MPPVDPIELWVKRKILSTTNKSTRSLAFAIATTIARHGTRALHDPDVGHMFERGLSAAMPALRRIADNIGATLSHELKA
jgi:hypothetical protein